jgi:hypothetical protein
MSHTVVSLFKTHASYTTNWPETEPASLQRTPLKMAHLRSSSQPGELGKRMQHVVDEGVAVGMSKHLVRACAQFFLGKVWSHL